LRLAGSVTAPALRGLRRFAESRGVPGGWAFRLDHDVIEAFCMTGLAGRAPATRGTYRSALYRLPVQGCSAGLGHEPAGTLMHGGGLGIPEPGTLLDDQAVTFAAGLTGRGGKAPVIEAALAHATGRPRPLPARAVLTALPCLAPGDRPLFLTEATRLLSGQLSDASRALRGVTGTIPAQRAFLAAYRRVRYCFHQILSVADPSPLPKNRRLTEDDLKARTRPLTPGQAEAARGRPGALINALPEASITVLTDAGRAASGGCTGLDATPVSLFSRGPSKRTGLCASDPDGGWYVREGDHRDREDNSGKPLRKIAWALEATIATMARLPGAPPACPNLAAGLALTRPGEDPGGTGARVLASLAARGHKPGPLGFGCGWSASSRGDPGTWLVLPSSSSPWPNRFTRGWPNLPRAYSASLFRAWAISLRAPWRSACISGVQRWPIAQRLSRAPGESAGCAAVLTPMRSEHFDSRPLASRTIS